MLSSQALVTQVTAQYELGQLHKLERVHQQKALQTHINTAVYQLYRQVFIASLIIGPAIILCGLLVTLLNDNAYWFLGSAVGGFAVAPIGLFVRNHLEQRVVSGIRMQTLGFQPTTKLTTELVNDGGNYIQTVLTVENKDTVVERILVDVAEEDSIAVAARVKTRNEEVLSQLQAWREQSTIARSTDATAIRSEHTDTINTILAAPSQRSGTGE